MVLSFFHSERRMERDMKKLAISVAEFCEAVGCGRTKAFELINDGTLDVLKLGRRTFIKMSSVDALLESDNSACADGDQADCHVTP